MEEFVNNISSISWWLAVTVSGGVGYLISLFPKRAKYVLKGFARLLKRKELTKIRSKRFNYSAVNYEIVKTHCLMLLFSGLCIAYFFLLLQMKDTTWLVVLIKALPLYVVEIAYLNQRSFTKLLVKKVALVRNL